MATRSPISLKLNLKMVLAFFALFVSIVLSVPVIRLPQQYSSTMRGVIEVLKEFKVFLCFWQERVRLKGGKIIQDRRPFHFILFLSYLSFLAWKWSSRRNWWSSICRRCTTCPLRYRNWFFGNILVSYLVFLPGRTVPLFCLFFFANLLSKLFA